MSAADVLLLLATNYHSDALTRDLVREVAERYGVDDANTIARFCRRIMASDLDRGLRAEVAQ